MGYRSPHRRHDEATWLRCAARWGYPREEPRQQSQAPSLASRGRWALRRARRGGSSGQIAAEEGGLTPRGLRPRSGLLTGFVASVRLVILCTLALQNLISFTNQALSFSDA